MRLFLKKAMVKPKKTAANTSAPRDYHRTSSILRGPAKTQPAEQTSSLLQFGFTTKPKPCESAAGETPPSKTATPSESSSATPIATQQASAGNGTSPGTNTRAGPDAATFCKANPATSTASRSRNVYREQQQFFSKDSTAQLIQWFHDGNDNKTKKVGHRVPDKDRAQSLINLGYEQRPSDLTDDVFLKKLVKRVKQWFVSYSAKSKKRTSNSYIASATEVVHQLMPTDIIESTVAAKGDAPSGQERDAASASTASTDLDVATATRCPKKSKPRMPKPKVMPTIAEPIAKPASTSTSS